MRKCGLYVRVSTDIQAREKEGSLKSQLQRLREELAERSKHGEPWVEVKCYVEEGLSGKDTNRPQFQNLIRDVETGAVDTIVCVELSRVSRSVLDFLSFVEYLNRNQAQFVALKQRFDTTSPYGRVLITICVALAQFERELTAERTSENMKARSRRGLWNGGHLFGYRLDPEKKGYLLVNEDEAAVVRLAFQIYLKHGSYQTVAHMLNERGYRKPGYTSRRGKVHPDVRFRVQTVRYILSNRAYIAEKEVNKKLVTKDQESLKPQDRYQIVPAVWPAILERETFDAVHALIAKNARTCHNAAAQREHPFLLTGLLRCGHCGCLLQGASGTSQSGATYFYYRHKRGDQTSACVVGAWPAEQIEEILLDRMKYLADRRDILDEITEAATSHLKAEVPKAIRLLDGRKRELADLAAEAEAWLAKALEFPAEQVQEFVVPRLEDIRTRKRQLEEEVRLLERSLDELKGNVCLAVDIQKILVTFKRLFQELAPHEQQELLAYIVRDVTIWADKMEIALFGDADPGRFQGVAERFAQRVVWLPGQQTRRTGRRGHLILCDRIALSQK